ncbi:xylulokinase [Actibacterium ureilyticum]|uniref:xylulokinase n=1 Tax=Actibacterium ureilyticum TaxID=1590614 RepID=UPI000BAB0829|nr:xylulokinase [Actibacterium ureilyticum]
MYLGLDLGTSGLRATLVYADGIAIASTEATYPIAHPHPGWSEQAPSDWVDACRTAIDALAQAHPQQLAALRGIGLSGQMHGAVCLGKDDTPLRPAILWNDTRCADEAGALDAQPQVRALSGNIVFPGFTAPKLLWMETHEPELFAQVDCVLLPKDYLRLWLTGERVAEMSDAAGTSWLDVGARDWSDTLLEAGHMRRDQMPRVIEGSAVAGQLRDELRQAWGIPHPVAVVGGGGDNAVAACGVGAMREGQGFVSLGTSGVLLAARDGFHPAPETAVHTFCHAVPDTWYQMGVILAATDCLNWLARITGQKPAALSALTGDRITGPSDLTFLPYLSGERTPHNDSRIRGAFLNLDIGHDAADMTRAVMEGVAFALRDNLQALKSTGAALHQPLAIGGGAQSEFWVRTLATVLDLPLDLPQAGDFGAALGAARLAMAGVTGDDPAQIMSPPPIARNIEPDRTLTGAYDDAYRRYKNAYPAMKGLL